MEDIKILKGLILSLTLGSGSFYVFALPSHYIIGMRSRSFLSICGSFNAFALSLPVCVCFAPCSLYVYIYTNMCAYINEYICICMYICVYIHVYMTICMYIFIHHIISSYSSKALPMRLRLRLQSLPKLMRK